MKRTMLATVLFCALVLCGSARAELTGIDIGSTWPPNPAGTLTIIAPGSDYFVDAAGLDIWGNADSFHYAYEPVMVTGDFEAIVRVDSLVWLTNPADVDPWAKAGIMARANLMEYSAQAMVCRTGHNGVCLQARQVEDRHSIHKDLSSGDVFGSLIWIKLTRKGNVFAAWWALDNAGVPDTWQNPTITWVDMPTSIYLGLATTSHYNIPPNNLATAIYRKFSVGPLTDFPSIPNFGPLPGPEGGSGMMGIREVIDNGIITNQDDCYNSLESELGTIVDYNIPVLNITDSGPIGHFGSDANFGVVTAGYRTLGSVDHLSVVAKGAIEIPTAGYYTFCITTDDGFTLQFPGHDFAGFSGDGEIIPFANGNALRLWGSRPLADTFGTIYLSAGHCPFVLTYHEDTGGSAVEFSAAPGAMLLFDGDFLLIGSSEMVPAKPAVHNPPEINKGAGWPVTMVYEPYTNGSNQSDELDSAIGHVEAEWGDSLLLPNKVVTVTAKWLNYEDPQSGGGGKGFPQKPFPGSDDGLDNNHFAMGAGTRTPLSLFAIRDGTDGTYTIDVKTGGWTWIGPSGVTGYTCGLTHSGGSVLYGSIPNRMSVIQTDGSGVAVMGSKYIAGMAYDIATDTLYGTDGWDFFVVDTNTGNHLMDLPSMGMWVHCLAFVPSVGAQGSVYGIGTVGYLYRYDVDSNTISVVGNTGLSLSVNIGMAYAPNLDVLFLIWGDAGVIYTIDKNTAAATFVANTSFPGPTGFSGLAYGPGLPGPSTIMTVHEPGTYTFLMYSDDSCQFRILDLAGNDPFDWDINDHEMPVGNEIVRLPDGTGFRFHGWGVDAKGTIDLPPGDHEVQVMFNDRTGGAHFGLWCSKDDSQIFLLGDTKPVPEEPEIYALELVCPYKLVGDANHDCRVNFLDVAMTAMNWLIDCAMNPSDPACIHK